MGEDLTAIGLLPSELQAVVRDDGSDAAGGHSWSDIRPRLLRELNDIGDPATLCEGEAIRLAWLNLNIAPLYTPDTGIKYGSQWYPYIRMTPSGTLTHV
jgi:hypothetical protein